MMYSWIAVMILARNSDGQRERFDSNKIVEFGAFMPKGRTIWIQDEDETHSAFATNEEIQLLLDNNPNDVRLRARLVCADGGVVGWLMGETPR
jgi:hypothetical protein